MSLPGVVIRIGGVAAECDVRRASLIHGRDDPSSQPSADAATLELLGVLPAEARIGSPLAVYADWLGVEVPRFAGRISDIAVRWDAPDIPLATVIAVGELAELGRRKIIGGGAGAGMGEQLDGQRADRALLMAGVTRDPARSDPGTLYLYARDVAPAGLLATVPAAEITLEAAVSGNGMVWQATDGAVLYADAEHRRGEPPAVTIDACDVPLDINWRLGLEGLCNDATIGYGNVQPKAEVYATNAASIAEHGTYAATLATALRDAPEAVKRADLIVARQASPAWVVDGLAFPLEAEYVDPALTDALLGLEVHSLLTLTGLPSSSPYPAAHLFVEGWTERIEGGGPDGPGGWLLTLAVSEYCRTAPPPRWDDVAATWLWDAIDPALTWDSITCLAPPLPASGGTAHGG